ncbi:hypothetical protein LCM08_08875 [Salipiger pacificus]|nr:hypothetical protein [Alloyangia pacifica]MCA0945023.1 hypothetical protein [Alloyangia pacifica]
MITEMIGRVAAQRGLTSPVATALVLRADPLDLVLYQEQVWEAYRLAQASPAPTGTARQAFWNLAEFQDCTPVNNPAWYHLGASYVLENSRVLQIFRKVVQEYRGGETLGIPSRETQRWLDITETLVFGADNPIAAWLSTSQLRPDPEAVRRNAYWRMFGLDLAFGTEDNAPPSYHKARAANTSFVALFEELLHEIWLAISNSLNTSGQNVADLDRIFRIAEELKFILRSRRQALNLDREELSAATALSWLQLSVSFNTSIVVDLKAEATSAQDRLMMIGQRVGLSAHSRSSAMFSMASDLSLLLRVIESGVVSSPATTNIFFQSGPGQIGNASRRVITEWAAASGKDLKARARSIDIRGNAMPARA